MGLTKCGNMFLLNEIHTVVNSKCSWFHSRAPSPGASYSYHSDEEESIYEVVPPQNDRDKKKKKKKDRKISSGLYLNDYKTLRFGRDDITRIKGCATMWHENSEEMIEMIKSIFR